MSFAKRRRSYTNVGTVVMDFCEVCGNFDLDVLEVHHLIPRNTRDMVGQDHKHGDGGVIVLCANDHKKLHMMYGGQARNPYKGPIEKDVLIERLAGMRRTIRRNYKNIDNSLKNAIVNEYNSKAGTFRSIARKYRVSRFTIEKLLKQATLNGGVFRDPPPPPPPRPPKLKLVSPAKPQKPEEPAEETLPVGRLRTCLCGVSKWGDPFWTHVRGCEQGDRDLRRVLGVKGI